MSQQTKNFPDSYKNNELDKFFNIKANDFEAALNINRDINRKALTKALEKNAKRLKAPKEVFEAIAKLAQDDSKAVLTGQQAGLLLGPNYTISKAVSAIKLAQKLNSEQNNVLAVFWVASQDHDTEEVDHAYLLDFKEELHKLSVDLPADTPIGKIALQDSWVEEITNQISRLGYNEPFLSESLELITNAAKPSESYSDWFIAMLYQLLGPYGLIIIDPMQREVAELFRPIFEAELDKPLESSRIINKAAADLETMGLKAQIGRAEGASNLFLEQNHSRQLLKFDGKMFYTADNQYSKEELQSILDKNPAAITPAAGLRPITQDFILPTVATVVGPGELAYFSQLKGVFELHNVTMPLIQPRLTATVLEPPVVRIMQKFELDLNDIAQLEKIKQDKLLELSGYQDIFNENLVDLEKSFESMLNQIKQLDPTLVKTVCKAEIYMQKTHNILKTKSARALLEKNKVYHNQFKRLENQLLPQGTAQERLLSPFSFFLKFGVENIIKEFMDLPFEGNFGLEL